MALVSLNPGNLENESSKVKIPQVKVSRRDISKGDLLMSEEPVSNQVAAERFKILKAKIERINKLDNHCKLITVTSAIPGEGKSSISVNLSRALAKTPLTKTLLIDCDLRKPSINKFFNLNQSPGLSDVLVSNRNLPSVIHNVEPGLDVICAGDLGEHDAARAIEEPKLAYFFRELKKHYQYIIVDSPPALLCPEPITLSTITDAVILVVRAWHTDKQLVQETLDLLGSKKILGIVMNDGYEDKKRYDYYKYYYNTGGKDGSKDSFPREQGRISSVFHKAVKIVENRIWK